MENLSLPDKTSVMNMLQEIENLKLRMTVLLDLKFDTLESISSYFSSQKIDHRFDDSIFIDLLLTNASISKQIYLVVQGDTIFNELTKQINEFQFSVKPLIKNVHPFALNKFKWFITSKLKKISIIASIKRMNTYLDRVNPIIECFENKVQELRNTPLEVIHKALQEKYIANYAQLESLEIDTLPAPAFSMLLGHAEISYEKMIEIKKLSDETLSLLPEKAKQMHHALAEKAFNQTDVHTFSKIYPGMNLTILKRNKIQTLEELERAIYLEQPFIHKVYSSKRVLIASLTNYLEELQENVPFRFNAENPSEAEIDLLHSLYFLYMSHPLIEELTAIKEEYEKKIDTIVQNMKSSKPWNKEYEETQSDNKEKWEKKKEDLKRFLHTYEETIEKNHSAIFTFYNVSDQEVFEDYTLNSTQYYILLEEYELVARSDFAEHSDLTQEIIDNVKSLKLKKSYLKASLRGWQSFGAQYALTQKKVLLGDEMGLGKTVQAIAFLAHLFEEGLSRFLVICPASILINWSREINTHSHLSYILLHGSKKEENIKSWIESGGIGITTYATASKMSLEQLLPLDALIVDEAHYIKNPKAMRSQFVYELTENCEHVMYMTGTPLENHVEEMEQLITKLQPEIMNRFEEKPLFFSKEFFREAIAPVYLRRNKEDVLTELPDLMQIEEYEPFSSKEFSIYKEAVKEGQFMLMRRAAWLDGRNSPKLKRLIEICMEAIENGKKVLIFSFFKDVIKTVYEALEKQAAPPIVGSVSSRKRQEIVDEFTRSKSSHILIAQIQAGGVGLNIQAASIVIFCEPQIKPALETQAVARSLRMGQTQTVFVYRLLTENSIDEAMMDMLQNKQNLFDTYAKDSFIAESAESSRDTSEEKVMQQIISQERQRLNMKTVEEEEGFVDF